MGAPGQPNGTGKLLHFALPARQRGQLQRRVCHYHHITIVEPPALPTGLTATAGDGGRRANHAVMECRARCDRLPTVPLQDERQLQPQQSGRDNCGHRPDQHRPNQHWPDQRHDLPLCRARVQSGGAEQRFQRSERHSKGRGSSARFAGSGVNRSVRPVGGRGGLLSRRADVKLLNSRPHQSHVSAASKK